MTQQTPPTPDGLTRKLRTDTELLDSLIACAHRGCCPGIIFDDNGHWAVTDDGMQNVPFGPEPIDIQTTFYVRKDKWLPSLRDAINAYLDEDEEGDEQNTEEVST